MSILGEDKVVFAQLKHKLQSQRGASLSMALMLFLVCAVVASIVLAASTATAGRQSQLETMDKSYYNVTSAAKLFWNELKQGSQTVTITRECDATMSGGSYENLTNWKGSVDTFSSDDNSGSGAFLSKSNATLFELVAYDMVFSPSSTSYSFNDTRALTGDTVAGSIEASTLAQKGMLKNATYDGITVTAASDYKDVLVKVSRSENGGLHLKFGEKKAGNPGDSPDFVAKSYKCALSSSVDKNDLPYSVKKIGTNTYHLTWVTKIYWDTQNLELGGGAS